MMHSLILPLAGCFAVVYQPMFAQVVKTLGRRCVWKREEVTSSQTGPTDCRTELVQAEPGQSEPKPLQE